MDEMETGPHPKFHVIIASPDHPVEGSDAEFWYSVLGPDLEGPTDALWEWANPNYADGMADVRDDGPLALADPLAGSLDAPIEPGLDDEEDWDDDLAADLEAEW